MGFLFRSTLDMPNWCDDEVEDIDPDAQFFIAIDMDSGY